MVFLDQAKFKLSTIQNPILKTTDSHGSNYQNAKGVQKQQKYVFLHNTRQRINFGYNRISLHSVPSALMVCLPIFGLPQKEKDKKKWESVCNYKNNVFLLECHSQEKSKRFVPHFSLLLPWAVELPHECFQVFLPNVIPIFGFSFPT